MNRDVNFLPEPVGMPETDATAGFGTLETDRGRLPLVALAVSARINGLMAQMQLRQTFRNALDETLEATYIFPLPDRAAVTHFQMRVAGRTVDGQLKERSQAREQYEEAIAQGHRAAIAEEDRSGVFQLRVGNLPPREEAVVELTLVCPLPVTDGEATFRFPLVVAPRYTPGIPLDGPSVGSGVTPDTDQVPDASRVTPPVLLPGFPNPVALSLEVELDPVGIAVDATNWPQQIRSSLHSVITDHGPPWTIRLQPGERLNRDFILRVPVTQSTLATSLVCSPATNGRPGTFALTLLPPQLDASTNAKPMPRRIVFLLDRSGSMAGWKLVAARRAVGRMIDTLLEHDQFTVLAFDNVVDPLPMVETATGFVSGTDRHRWQALEWLGKVDARGGTEMGPAIEMAVSRCSDTPAGCDDILILVTDGQTTGEDAILQNLSNRRRQSGRLPRIFTIGIDQAVNAGFLRRLADFGQGQCELVESENRLDEAMDHLHRLLGQPLLRQLRMEPCGCPWVDDSLAPQRVSDLFADRPVTIFGRHHGDSSSLRLRLEAVGADGQPWQQEVTGHSANAEFLTSLWGRAKVRDLEDEYAAGAPEPEALAQRIIDVSLESHVLSRFTAYVAVDRSEVVQAGGKPIEITQPVELPAGWADSVMCCGLVGSGYPRMVDLCSAPEVFRTLSLGEPSERIARRVIASLEARMRWSRESGDPSTAPSAEEREYAQQQYLTKLATQNSDDARYVMVAILKAGIQAAASSIVIKRYGRFLRVCFQLQGKLAEHVRLPANQCGKLLVTLCNLTGISPNASAWPQQSQCEVEGVRLDVTINLTQGQETAIIIIQPQQPVTPTSATARHKPFWR